MVIGIVALFVTAGLVVDGAVVYWNRAELASRADSAALAGGGELPNTVRSENRAYEYLALHDIVTSTHTISVTFSQRVFLNDSINVRIWRPVNTSFLHLIGINIVDVSAEAEVFSSAFSGDQSWSMFRGGPTRSGFQACNGLDSNVDSVQYQFGHRWLTNDGAAHRSTPATFTDVRLFSGHPFVVVGSNDNSGGSNGADANSGPKVYAFDTINGNTLWTTDLGLGASPSKVRSSPLVAIIDGLNGSAGSEYPVVLVGAHNGRVYALDARDGSTLWISNNDNDDFESDGAYRSSPALTNEAGTFFAYQATSRGNVYKYVATSGATVWRSTPWPGAHPYENANIPANWVTTSWGDTPGNTEDYWGFTTIYGTVNIADVDGVGTTLFVINHGKDDWAVTDPAIYMFAINPADGTKRWVSSTHMGTAGNTNSRDSAAVGKVDTTYNGVADSWRVYAAPTDGYLYSFNAVTGALVYNVDTGFKHHRGDPVIYCDIVFGGNDNGIWAMTAATGVSIWDNADSDGAGPDQVNPEYDASLYSAFGEYELPGGVKSAPAIASGVIMAGTNETSSGGKGGALWALDTRTGKDLGHWDTTAYDPSAGIGLGPAPAPSDDDGDVRSGIVISNNLSAYFGSKDTGLYEVYIKTVLILVK